MNELSGTRELSLPNRSITLETDRPFNVEITGDEKASTAVILVHGFGVKSESRGLFTDIEQQIGTSAVAVRGDFANLEEGNIHAIPFSEQVMRLKVIIDYTKNQLGKSRMVFIGHSQGSIVVAQTQPEGSQVFLLAPPIDSPFTSFIATDGWKRPGSALDLEGQSRLSRSDGSTTFVGKKFWDEFKEVDAKKIYQDLSKNNDVNIVLAEEDQVLGKQSFPDGVYSSSIKGADHDFKGDARKILVKELVDRMKIGNSNQ